MAKIILYIVFLFLLFGCAADISVSKNSSPISDLPDSTDSKRKAMEHVIKASVADLKQEYAEAILEYQDAIKLDPSPGIYYALAKDYYRINKLPLAVQFAEESVKLDSSNIEYYMLLANIYTASRKNENAVKIYEKVLTLDTVNVNAYYSLGMLYEDEKPLKALEIYEKLIKITGPEWNILIKIADLNERMGNIDKTIETVENMLKLNPSNLELQKLLIDSYIKTSKTEKAVTLLEDALTLYPDDVDLIEYNAKVYIQTEDWEKGSDEYLKIIENKKINFESKVRIGAAFLNQSFKDSTLIPVAIKILQRIDSDSADWQVKAYLGEIYSLKGDDSTAVNYFLDASELAAWSADLWTRIGGILFDSGRYEDAAVQMEKALARFPDEFVFNIIEGLSLSQVGKYSKADPFLLKSVKMKPDDITALQAYGFNLNQLKREDEAIIYLERALDIDDKNIQVLGLLGLIYESKEIYHKSDSIYEKALSVDSTDILILNNFAYSLAERGIQLERALFMVKNAVKVDPENSSYLDTKGWVYYKLGEFDKAIEFIEKALELDKDNPTLLDHLGDVYFKLQNNSKAIELWKEAYELDKDNEKLKSKIIEGAL